MPEAMVALEIEEQLSIETEKRMLAGKTQYPVQIFATALRCTGRFSSENKKA